MRLRLTKAAIIDFRSKQVLEDGLRVWISGDSGSGKALALDTLIPTPSGWTTIGEVQVGDTIYNDHGVPCSVVATSEVMHGRSCYEVTFDTGARITADGEHLWWTFTAAERHREYKASPEFREHRRLTRSDSKRRWRRIPATPYVPPPFVGGARTTEEVAQTVTWGVHRREHNHAVKVHPGLSTLATDLPIHPYALGVWLGDGTTTTAVVTKPDAALFTRLRAVGFPSHKIPSARMGRRIEGLERLLRLNNLLGNKHIPSSYFRASREQRLELLRGLMDTDGHACAQGSVEFSNTNYAIAQGVAELARTLGHKVAVKKGTARLNGKVIGPYWRMTWTPPEPVFTLPRKVRAQRLGVRTTLKWHYVTRVHRVPSVPVKCIAVSGPSRLFLASEHMIPTHNSSAVMLLASQLVAQNGQVVILDPHGECGDLKELAPHRVKAIGYAGAAYATQPVEEGSVDWCLDMVREGFSLCTDLRHWSTLEPLKMDAFVLKFATALYALRQKHPKQTLLVVDEAHTMVPQNVNSSQVETVRIFTNMVTGGRKFGLYFALVSQRPALVDFQLVRSCNVRVFLRVTNKDDWDKVKKYVPAKLGIGFGEGHRDISKFRPGEAVLFSPWWPTARVQLLAPDVEPTRFLKLED